MPGVRSQELEVRSQKSRGQWKRTLCHCRSHGVRIALFQRNDLTQEWEVRSQKSGDRSREAGAEC
jgi:hypothetical protein